MGKSFFITLACLFISLDICAVETVSRVTWNRLKAKAKARYVLDVKTYSKDDMLDANELYNKVKRQWKTEEGKKSLKLLQEIYPKASRTGCAIVEAGKRCAGQDKFDLLQLAVDKYGDCFYSNGVQVGPYAQLLLASAYARKGDLTKSDQLLDGIIDRYPDAINHSGENLAALITEYRLNQTTLTESFKISSGKENRFSLENRLIKVSGTLGETPLEEKKEPDFFTAHVNAEIIRLEKKRGVILSIACYSKNNRLIFADSANYSAFGKEKNQCFSPINCLIPHYAWEKADHYVISILIGEPDKEFARMLEPGAEL